LVTGSAPQIWVFNQPYLTEFIGESETNNKPAIHQL
jgi:hypothetical protein